MGHRPSMGFFRDLLTDPVSSYVLNLVGNLLTGLLFAIAPRRPAGRSDLPTRLAKCPRGRVQLLRHCGGCTVTTLARIALTAAANR